MLLVNHFAVSTELHSLFAIPIHVKRNEGAEMPAELLGAYLVCYVSAANHLRALELAVQSLREDRYRFVDLNGEISELDPNKWDLYVRATWPEQFPDLPTQSELLQRLRGEGVFYGPLCCYEKDEDD